MRFAILGAGGQLGRAFAAILPGVVKPLSRTEIDLTRLEPMADTVAALGVEVLINCAAYNYVDRAESEPESAFAVNAWGVRALARACQNVGVKLVHFSTNYVFGLDVLRTEPYHESDPPGPVSVYGLSKLAGEYFALAECPESLVIRTCGLFGRGSGGKGSNFVEAMMRLAAAGDPIRVVSDQICTPSYCLDVANASLELIDRGQFGLYHVTNGGSCSWHEFAVEIFRQLQLKPNLIPVRSHEFGATAARPKYSVLANEKLVRVGVATPRSWQVALADYLEHRSKNNS